MVVYASVLQAGMGPASARDRGYVVDLRLLEPPSQFSHRSVVCGDQSGEDLEILCSLMARKNIYIYLLLHLR